MLYFVKEGTIHRFPAPDRCGAVRENEPLRDTVIHGVKECPFCMHRWPGEEE